MLDRPNALLFILFYAMVTLLCLHDYMLRVVEVFLMQIVTTMEPPTCTPSKRLGGRVYVGVVLDIIYPWMHPIFWYGVVRVGTATLVL